jgi:hypothetical protein
MNGCADHWQAKARASSFSWQQGEARSTGRVLDTGQNRCVREARQTSGRVSSVVSTVPYEER